MRASFLYCTFKKINQNVITVTNPDMSIKTVGRESGKKNQRTTRTEIKRRNVIIAKRKITKKRIDTRRKRLKKNLQTQTQTCQ